MSVIGSNILAGSSGQGGYFLTNSLRFRSSASAYLDRTPPTASNRKTWTWSAWVKRGNYDTNSNLFGAVFSSTSDRILFEAANRLWIIFNDTTDAELLTTQVFRDFAAWYHIVLAVDTTQATASNRIKLYVNGVQVTTFTTANYPTQNRDGGVNNNVSHKIGVVPHTSGQPYDGYQTEVNFIDGLALTPSSFGETSTTTGVWIPKKYSGTYGTNGFYLPFTNTSSTSTLGNDFSGNSNTWTVNNISLTAGSTYDSMTDVPTLTSATAANYCVLSPLNLYTGTSCANGNLQGTTVTGAECGIYGTIGMTSGKFYWESTPSSISSGGCMIGIAPATTQGSSGSPGLSVTTGYGYYTTGSKYAGSGGVAYGNTFTTSDVIGCALDLDNGKIWWSKNGVFQASGDPAAGTNAAFTSVSGTFVPGIGNGGSGSFSTVNVNFGQQPFAYTPPTGFVALNTFNLPTPTIGATASTLANEYMDVLTWTGNGASSRAITGLNFQPDWVWDKMRSDAYQHAIVDSVRGGNQVLHSNSTSAEDTNWQYGYVSSFDSNGFTIQAGSTSSENWNLNAATFVAWNWNAGGSTVTNTTGSISSQVRANTTAGFSIVTYTGNGTSGATVGHGLGVAPSMYIVKVRSTTESWITYHISIGATNFVALNLTQASTSATAAWNNTAPTSTVFSLGNASSTNGSGATFVAYCFTPIAGYSAFGSYTGNSSTDGTFVYLGFRPRFVMIKRATSADPWIIHDTARDIYNGYSVQLYPNDSSAEGGPYSPPIIDEVSNGFKLRSSASGTNDSGSTYIYMAFAENPFKYANAR